MNLSNLFNLLKKNKGGAPQTLPVNNSLPSAPIIPTAPPQELMRGIPVIQIPAPVAPITATVQSPVVSDGNSYPAPIIPLSDTPLQTEANMNFPAQITPPPAPMISDTSVQERLAQSENLPPAPIASVARSQELQNQINQIDKKDYSIKKDEAGNVIHRGADRDKKWSIGDKIASGLLGALTGFARGGIGGAVAGGISAGTDRNYQEKRKDQINRGALTSQYGQTVEAENNLINQDYKKATTENIYADNQFNREKAAQTAEEFSERMKYNRSEQERKVDDRTARERTSRMNTVAGMFKNLPAYDPTDSRFADITKALGDVNLPITPKDSRKKVDLKQDQRTGAWEMVLTDPLTGKQEVRSVTKDGQQLKTTPTVVMQGEYGLTKQENQQQFTGQQNEKNRELRRVQIVDAANRFAETLKLRKQSLALQQQALTSKDEATRARAEMDIRKFDAQMNNLKTLWRKRVKDGSLTEDEYNELTADMP